MKGSVLELSSVCVQSEVESSGNVVSQILARSSLALCLFTDARVDKKFEICDMWNLPCGPGDATRGAHFTRL